MNKVQYYLGRFTQEKHLFDKEQDFLPSKGDLVFFENEVYKVRYVLFDCQFNEYCVFLQSACEEEY